MDNATYALPLMLILLTGFSSASITPNVFGQNYIDVSNGVNSIHPDQMTSEENEK